MMSNSTLLAQKLILDIQKPCIYLSEITQEVGLSDAVVRMNAKRRNIILEHTPRAGRGQGVKAVYPLCDLIEVMALAELSKAGFPLKRTGTNPKAGSGIAFVISNLVLGCIRARAGYVGIADAKPYAIVFFSADYSGIDVMSSKSSTPDFPNRPEYAWAVIDCLALADRAIDFYASNPSIFGR